MINWGKGGGGFKELLLGLLSVLDGIYFLFFIGKCFFNIDYVITLKLFILKKMLFKVKLIKIMLILKREYFNDVD